jgi:hypothetical protein
MIYEFEVNLNAMVMHDYRRTYVIKPKFRPKYLNCFKINLISCVSSTSNVVVIYLSLCLLGLCIGIFSRSLSPNFSKLDAQHEDDVLLRKEILQAVHYVSYSCRPYHKLIPQSSTTAALTKDSLSYSSVHYLAKWLFVHTKMASWYAVIIVIVPTIIIIYTHTHVILYVYFTFYLLF